MLYYPKWQKPEPNPLEGLIAWLKHQPPETKYDWCCPHTCVVASYMKSVDLAYRDHKFPISIGATQPWAYGAALQRAEEVLNERIKTTA